MIFLCTEMSDLFGNEMICDFCSVLFDMTEF
jgi:hypothetical protein